MKTSYDKRTKVVPYQVGQYVYVWRPRPPHNKNKFYDHFYGPFKIIKHVTDYTYKLDLGGKSKMHDVVPHDLLRLAPEHYAPQIERPREYDQKSLELDHRMEVIPEESEILPSEPPTQHEENTSVQRPVIHIQHQNHDLNNQHPNRQLRDRAGLRPPDRFQAGF